MASEELTKEARRVIKLCAKGKNVLLHGPGGTGKCLSPYTEIKMYRSSPKMAMDIVPFDLVMGDDGHPRCVVSINSGLDAMYTVTYNSQRLAAPISFGCNSVHILTLYSAKGSTKDVPLDVYLKHAELYKDYTGIYLDEEFVKHTDATITVKLISEMSMYYGFTLAVCNGLISSTSDVGRFVLENGIVTHNTYSIRQVADYLDENEYTVGRCATTGIASLNLHTARGLGKTVHSWAGIGLGQAEARTLATTIMMSSGLRKRWENADVLIIEEISMMGAELLDKLDYIGQKVRGDPAPFGGIQIIAVGDFLQLPPVKAEWVFLSKVWSRLKFVPVIFKEPKRYEGEKFFSILQRVRKGAITSADSKIFRQRLRAYEKLVFLLNKAEKDGKKAIRPTVVFTTNARVDGYNKDKLMDIDEESFFYEAADVYTSKAARSGRRTSSEALKELHKPRLDEMIPDVVELKVGAQVMLKRNIDIESGLCNGSRGVVTRLTDDSVAVSFINGERRCIAPFIWEYVTDTAKCSRTQMPLILAWACTVHKSQGLTLDYAVCDIGSSIFCGGQAYVALSRVRSIKGLFLSGYSRKSIYSEEDALDYVKSIEGE